MRGVRGKQLKVRYGIYLTTDDTDGHRFLFLFSAFPISILPLLSTRTPKSVWVAQATRLCRPATGRTEWERRWLWKPAREKVLEALSPLQAARRRPAQASGLCYPPDNLRLHRSYGSAFRISDFSALLGWSRARSIAHQPYREKWL